MLGIKEFRNQMSRSDTADTEPRPDLSPYKRHFLDVADKCTEGRFKVDARNKGVVADLFLYFLGQPGNLDLRKGLWLEGPVGTGKSTLMYVFSQFMRSLKLGFKVHICSQITTGYSLNGDLSRYLDNAGWSSLGPVDMCFDELGKEPIPAKYFGNELNVMQHILHIRYSYWQQTGLKTYVTTNTNGQDIQDKYGVYIRDRRNEMFNIIPLDGESRRK